jgi:hypothetical protein
MTRARITAALAVPLLALVSACGSGTAPNAARAGVQTSATGGVDPDPTVPATGVAAASSLQHVLAVARHTYANEVNGGRVHADLQLVSSDPVLLNDLASGDMAAAQAEAQYKMMSNAIDHITRIGVLRGGHLVVNAVWNHNGSFVVAPRGQTLYAHGRNLGTLLVSVQDVIGYVKLLHVFTGAYAVVRGSSGQVRASVSLPAAANLKLPSSGSVTIGGHRYRVGSFQTSGWGGEALTVWVLLPV